ncbi:hypothetical protein MRX96_021389 [Rhipicephalus microplus]
MINCVIAFWQLELPVDMWVSVACAPHPALAGGAQAKPCQEPAGIAGGGSVGPTGYVYPGWVLVTRTVKQVLVRPSG